MENRKNKQKSHISLRTSDHKGITLIALIITIIVMLILVGVTITVVLNTGLFDKAKEGTNKTEIEMDKETLQAAIVASIDTNSMQIADSTTLEENLPEGWEVKQNGNDEYTATSPNNNVFKVKGNGEIKELNNEEGTKIGVVYNKYYSGYTPGDFNKEYPTSYLFLENGIMIVKSYNRIWRL